MQLVNIHEAKSHLSKLVACALEGDDVIICKSGKPLVKLVRYQPDHSPRSPGYWRGQVHLAEDFNELPDSLSSAFKGEDA